MNFFTSLILSSFWDIRVNRKLTVNSTVVWKTINVAEVAKLREVVYLEHYFFAWGISKDTSEIPHEIIWVGKGLLYGKKRRSGVMPLSVAAFGGTEPRRYG